MIKSKKQSLIIVGAFVIALMLFTTTYAFFNYTRTGTANTIKTGRIAFNSSQGTAINLTNMFPIDVSEGIPNDNTKVGTVTINVTGDTTYTEGLEYKVSAVNVSNTVGNKTLPISVNVSVANNTNNDPATNLGTSDADYFTNRGGNSSIYKVLANDTINTDDELVVGYIAPGETGIDGNIIIMAYLDARNIAITDTYDASDPETDTNGTTTEWVGDRTVLTTQEWNAFQSSGVSFQVKVEANEGTWVENPDYVSTATFDTGPVVNTKLKLLFTSGEYTGQDLSQTSGYEESLSVPPFTRYISYSVNNIIKDNVAPDITNFNSTNILSSSSSYMPIYAWHDLTDNAIHWYTAAEEVYLNENSSYMFHRVERFKTESGMGTVNTSRVINMSSMFELAGFCNDNFCVDYNMLSNWNVSNVTNMSRMFYYEFWRQTTMGDDDASAISNWDVRNVQNFTNMFYLGGEAGDPSMYTYPIFTLRPGTWDNTPVQSEWGWDDYTGTYIPND